MSEGHPKVDTMMVVIRTFIKGEPGTLEFTLRYNTIYEIIEELVRKTELQDDIIEQVKIAVPWMVKSLAVGYENESMFSDELKHAIAVNELLKKI